MKNKLGLPRAANATTRREALYKVAGTLGGIALWSDFARGSAEDAISHSSEAIHQEPVFKASPARIYEVLTDAKQFDKVVQMGAAIKTGLVSAAKPTEISREVGGAFSLFGGLIVGRHVELVPGKRIVQAWRAAGDWKPGVYSIAKFELVAEGDGTRIVFDHRGFPDGDWEHLAAGWKANYWQPLAAYLA